MTDPPLLYTIEDGIARLTLNRPDRLNAFDVELARAWRSAAMEATTSPDVVAIMIDAAGTAFCAGGDVVAMSEQLDGPGLTSLANTINDGIVALTESAIPVVAAVHGAVVGGGLGILLASDYAVASDNTRIGSRYANVGLTPDLSVSARLGAAVGERRALQLVLQDRLLDAAEALDWGLVAEVVAPGEFVSRAAAVARSWRDGASHSIGQAKRLIRSRPSRDLAGQLAEEARTIGAAFDGDEGKERVRAFAETATARHGA